MSCCEAGASAGSLCGSRRDRSAARDDGRGRFPADCNYQLYFCGAKPAVGDAWRRGSEPDRLNFWILPDFRKLRTQNRRAPGSYWREEIGRHTSELQSLMRISYAVFCLKKKKIQRT